MLAPLVRLTLYCGLGHSEFSATVRRVFIEVASDDYGVRGRPANVSKISAKTGISRKSIQRARAQRPSAEWSPDDEVSPINTICHYWRFDEQFSSQEGTPKELPYEGDSGFVSLVKKYAGDIPASAIRQEFLRDGLATYTEDGLLKLVREFSFPKRLDEDFLRRAALSLGKHAETLFHNALIVDSGKVSPQEHREAGRFERYAWSRRLSGSEIRNFQLWVRDRGDEFISEADAYISRLENASAQTTADAPTLTGVGVYFFRER